MFNFFIFRNLIQIYIYKEETSKKLQNYSNFTQVLIFSNGILHSFNLEIHFRTAAIRLFFMTYSL